jgi:hypothetical protein
MAQLTINGRSYVTTGKLDAFTALHLARKLGPSLPIVEGLVLPENASKDKSILTVLMLSHISDTDSEFVIRKSLNVVGRIGEDGRPQKIQTPDGTLMFDDIQLAEILELTVAVIEENLGDFFRTALANMDKSARA